MLPPQEALLARAEAGEITAAELTSIWRAAKTQLEHRPGRRVVILERPGAQLIPKALGASRIFHQARFEDSPLKARMAAFAAELILAEPLPDPLLERARFGDSRIAGTTLRTGYFHRHSLPVPSCQNSITAPRTGCR
jgi:hypothetical protein